MRPIPLLLALVGCVKTEEPVPPTPEPIEVPADPAARGVPVGVRTVDADGHKADVYYPAPEAQAEATLAEDDLATYLPEDFLEATEGLAFPTFPLFAVRDAPVRVVDDPLPIVIFSHGYGGFRTQSVSLVSHLASRGYVVVTADHPGRNIGDLLPCMFAPPLPSCELNGFTPDPALDDLDDLTDWVQAEADGGFLKGLGDPENLGIFGHSAGGFSTATVAQTDERFRASLPMAAGGTVARDEPNTILSGTCDGIVTDADITAAWTADPDDGLVRIKGGGHHAFSDFCELGLLELADQFLAGSDANELITQNFIELGSDGCPGAEPLEGVPCEGGFLPTSESGPIVGALITLFFDAELKGLGGGIASQSYAEVEVVGR